MQNLRWLLGYQGARLLVGFFLGSWVARSLGPAQFGILATAAAVAAIAWCMVELGMRQLIIKELSRRKRLASVIAGTAFKLWLMLGIAVCSVLAMLNGMGEPHLPWGVFLAAMTPLALMCLTLHNNWEEADERSHVSARNSMVGYMGAAAARVAALICWPSLTLIAWTIALENVITGVMGMKTSQRRERGLWLRGWDSRIARVLLRRGAVLVLGQAGILLLLRTDVIMLEHIRGEEEAGLYGAAVRLSEMACLLAPMIVTILLPKLSGLLKTRDEGRFQQLTKQGSGLMVVLGTGSALLLLIGGPWVVRHLFGPAYEPSVPVLLVHCLSVIPYFLTQWRYAVMVALDRASVTAWLSWFAVVVNIGLNFAWMPQHGALGAAWATLISYTLCGVLATWLVRDLHWLARAQAQALMAPFAWLARPKQSWCECKHLLAPAKV